MIASSPSTCVEMICDECGAVRSTKMFRGRASLKCSGCMRTTNHQLAGFRDAGGLHGRHDWRESANDREVEHLRALRGLESIYEELGIEIVYFDRLKSQADKRAYFGIVRDRRNGGVHWTLELSLEATPAGRLDALRFALGEILKNEALIGVQPGERYAAVWMPPASRTAEYLKQP